MGDPRGHVSLGVDLRKGKGGELMWTIERRTRKELLHDVTRIADLDLLRDSPLVFAAFHARFPRGGWNQQSESCFVLAKTP